MSGGDFLPAGEDPCPLENVSELADIPRIRIGGEKPHGVLSDREVPSREPGEDGGGQDRDILQPFPERRKPDRKDVEAVEEILPEALVLHHGGEVPVRRRDEPDIGPQGGDSPDPPVDVGFKETEEFGLEGERQFPDLVQEESSAGGRLDQARLSRMGSGESPLLVAKELALDEIFRKPGTVDRHKGLVGPRRKLVDGLGDQLLSRSGLSQEKNGGGLGGHLVNVGQHARKRKGLPDKSVGPRFRMSDGGGMDPFDKKGRLTVRKRNGKNFHVGEKTPAERMVDMEGPGMVAPLPDFDQRAILSVLLAGHGRMMGDFVALSSHDLGNGGPVGPGIGLVRGQDPMIFSDHDRRVGKGPDKIVQGNFRAFSRRGRGLRLDGHGKLPSYFVIYVNYSIPSLTRMTRNPGPFFMNSYKEDTCENLPSGTSLAFPRESCLATLPDVKESFMVSSSLVDLSRLQFAVTALYHFLFVPLTLGLTYLLVIMETVYVMTGKVIYKDMTRFWGKLFGINFALGVTTGLTMEFEFGTNWSYYSHYVGDIFGAPLAIEGLMAFFLESTFVGLFFFGWDRLSKPAHLAVTFLTATGTNLSALWILVANGWMQRPVGAHFDPDTMRMEMTSFWEVFLNPVAQAKFVHTVCAGYVTASLFVLGISSWYLLKGRNVEFAKRSFRIAAAFGLATTIGVIILGDESGYLDDLGQKTKIAAIEAMWKTEPAPASFNIISVPDQKNMKNDFSIKIPYVLGLIATRSFDTPIPGLREIEKHNETRISHGIQAVLALDRYRANRADKAALDIFEKNADDLGFGLLMKQYVPDIAKATPADIHRAAVESLPRVTPLFWTFRFMVGLGFSFLALFALAFYVSSRNECEKKRWLLRWALYFIPMPYLASELGWFVAEYGRQPWSIYGILPTSDSVSTLSSRSLIFSLTGFTLFYTGLLAVELYLMFKYARLGPASLYTGRYEGEERVVPAQVLTKS